MVPLDLAQNCFLNTFEFFQIPSLRGRGRRRCVGPSSPGLPPCDVQHDPPRADVLEDGDGLGVGEALQGEAVHRQDLVA